MTKPRRKVVKKDEPKDEENKGNTSTTKVQKSSAKSSVRRSLDLKSPTKKNLKITTGDEERVVEVPEEIRNSQDNDNNSAVADELMIDEDLEKSTPCSRSKQHSKLDDNNLSTGKRGKKLPKPPHKCKLSNKEKRYRSPPSEESSSEESTEGELTETDQSVLSSEDGEDTDLESEIMMSLPSTYDEFSDAEIKEKLKEREKLLKQRQSRSRTRSPRKHRKPDSSAESSSPLHKRGSAKNSRKQKHKKSVNSDDEQMLKIVRLVKKEMKKSKKKSKSSKKGKAMQISDKIVTPLIKNPLIKSPSETTNYTPAITKNLVPREVANRLGMNSTNLQQEDKADDIANFLQSMRLISDKNKPQRREDSSTSQEVSQEKVTENPTISGTHQLQAEERRRTGRDIADELIVRAEKHKAAILPNKGKFSEEILDHVDPNNVNHMTDDGDFLHFTCHIEPTLRAKIQRGKYVELEKLLLKPKDLRKTKEETRLELVSKQGRAFIAPAEDLAKINGVRKWEQAFRIYATIYSQANPFRAPEIFQYINVINDAARSFSWECVAHYDYTFRRMMQQKPNRSWSKNFPELWTQCMTEPIQKQNYHSSSNERGKKDWRDYCCWRFNKSVCRHTNCRYEHKCTYCRSTLHPFQHCPQRGRGGGRRDSRDRDRERSSDRSGYQHTRKEHSKYKGNSQGKTKEDSRHTSE